MDRRHRLNENDRARLPAIFAQAPALLPWVYDDGGRAAAGFHGAAGDCVCRAIAIASEQPYADIYAALDATATRERVGRRKRAISHARLGVYARTSRHYLTTTGWQWIPTMAIGSGCQVHLRLGEVPLQGRLIVRLSRHLTAVVNGVIHDIYDPSRDGTRCVYGYFIRRDKGPHEPHSSWGFTANGSSVT